MTFREKIDAYKLKIKQEEIERQPMVQMFNECKAAIQIKDIADRYTELKPMGGYLKGECPFKGCGGDSFTISGAKEIFYCFKCHRGGDVISFVAAMRNISQLEAVEVIARIIAHKELNPA